MVWLFGTVNRCSCWSQWRQTPPHAQCADKNWQRWGTMTPPRLQAVQYSPGRQQPSSSGRYQNTDQNHGYSRCTMTDALLHVSLDTCAPRQHTISSQHCEQPHSLPCCSTRLWLKPITLTMYILPSAVNSRCNTTIA